MERLYIPVRLEWEAFLLKRDRDRTTGNFIQADKN